MWADGGLTEIDITFCIFNVFGNNILVNVHDVRINNEINCEIKLLSVLSRV